MELLLIDNNDSFTYNLFHLISSVTGMDVPVVKYQELDSKDITSYSGFVISPGPGHPEEYDKYSKIIDSGKPVFGVCLGMQILNIYFGGSVVRLDGCRHGVTRQTVCMGREYQTAVYNSLYCSKIPDVFNVFAVSDDIPMGIIHKNRPLAGVQFHPESFMTEDGEKIIKDVFSSVGII